MGKVKSEDKSLKSQLEDLENRLKRAVADYQNLEKRFEKESSSVVRFANLSLIERMLDVYDNLLRASKSINDQGLDMVIDQFNKILKEEGVEKIDTKSVEFDPNTMECTELVDGKKDQVVEVLAPGYKLHDRVIRPAQVKVGKGKSN